MNPIILQKPQLENLCQQYQVKDLYAFGSALREDFNENSDIDFLGLFFLNSILQYKFMDIIKQINDFIQDKETKRICFNSCHKDAFNDDIQYNSARSCINLPFNESIEHFIEKDTGLKIIKKKNDKYWCPANSEEEDKKLIDFVEKYKECVFLRDLLDCSISIAEHMKNEKDRTDIGELEYKAKYENDEESVDELSNIICDFIKNTNVYKDIGYICSIPSSKKENPNLPQKIIKKISHCISKEDISKNIEWKNEKKSLKELSLMEKLEELQRVDIIIDNNDIEGKDIILLDDLYQSGITMQYVALKLKEAGANRVFGISIVKSRKNTENV